MELSGGSQRWQGQRSAYSWEQSALEHIKAQMPDAEPYRAWQTFTFTTDQGHVREVDFLNQLPASERNRVTPTLSKQLPKLLQEIGIARLHRIGRVGPYELSEKSYDSGPTWEDYLAVNPSLPADYPRRVRVFLTERTATDEDRTSAQRTAHREYLAGHLARRHSPRRAVQRRAPSRPGGGLPARRGLAAPRPVHLRQPGPAAAHPPGHDPPARRGPDHAHRRHLYHRALAPRSVYVELTTPEPGPEQDPLTAGAGDKIGGWTVLRQLGTGSTSKALLVAQDGHPDRVFKVALNDAAARRLEREAQQLAVLNDSHVARLLDHPFPAGPAGTARADVQWGRGEKPGSVRAEKDRDSERTGPSSGPRTPPEPAEDLARLPVDEIVGRLIRLRNRWQKSVKELTSVRDDLVEILAAHGRSWDRGSSPPACWPGAAPGRATRRSGCARPRSASAPPSRPRNAANPPG